MKKTLLIGLAVLAAIAAVVVCLHSNDNDQAATSEDAAATQSAIPESDAAPGRVPAQPPNANDNAEPPQEATDDASDATAEEPLTPEEKKEREEEAKVEAFDNLTDTWQEPATNGVKMADVDRFVKQFASVPKDRKEECLHRALNLIPDENVMLLAGILMDKTQDKELVELVFNDILNRDEDVKKPILKQVLTDKKHPCWADAAWIEDVTKDVDAQE